MERLGLKRHHRISRLLVQNVDGQRLRAVLRHGDYKAAEHKHQKENAPHSSATLHQSAADIFVFCALPRLRV
jgi:hypothetical protein